MITHEKECFLTFDNHLYIPLVAFLCQWLPIHIKENNKKLKSKLLMILMFLKKINFFSPLTQWSILQKGRYNYFAQTNWSKLVSRRTQRQIWFLAGQLCPGLSGSAFTSSSAMQSILNNSKLFLTLIIYHLFTQYILI